MKYPPVLYTITDETKREKLEKIILALKAKHPKGELLQLTYYGCGNDSVPLDIVADWLDATVPDGDRKRKRRNNVSPRQSIS